MAPRFWLLPLAIILISPMTIRVPFEMRVVDEQTGIGIPNLRVTTEDGNVCHTRRRILLLVAIVADESECALPDLRREQPIHQPECDAHGSTRRPHDGRSSPTHVIRNARNNNRTTL